MGARRRTVWRLTGAQVDAAEVHKSLARIRERRAIKMMGWGPSGIQVALSRKSPFLRSPHRVSGLSLANHTSVHRLFQRSAAQFDKLRARNAFLDHYQKHELFRDSLAEFDDSRAVVADLIEEYQAAAKDDYLDWALRKEQQQQQQQQRSK